jgi:hypothetical protein
VTPTRRLLAAGGVVGPAAFVSAWVVNGIRAEHYDPLVDPISRLAASGAMTRPLMTTGFLAFSAGIAAFAAALHADLPGRAWIAAAVNAAATVGVASAPLDAGLDNLHAAFAFTGYASLAAMPVVAGRTPAERLVAVPIALALLGSIAFDGHTGLLQRTGLTLGDAWIVATAIGVMRGARRD